MSSIRSGHEFEFQIGKENHFALYFPPISSKKFAFSVIPFLYIAVRS